jgi:hypothetical protein
MEGIHIRNEEIKGIQLGNEEANSSGNKNNN